ncbi:MAG: alanine racemase [Deltaproteobacteria bacterium RIFCSPLOWO2_12_FULL_40_28]|nr:MAG: alanine racemase [Deltaproteobacteria bacterium RIFCSPHIGHO2_02_FULL_40_28]OGQ19687.1 MAG: alanine racemase [Deltaproteobacteria bacterium RIFCSPHIGHO2_12_FULL_40_32]OGQ40964.1 MAG: alanine racemase [Deltaproteobacteria bacterium RIFCSPLOWO2_02_FULL_40_36]OGQ54079.1 MAG: alanine racemase [Deltaproteobacteria bacterium RIFCSPLOWO2_12_FULL_40_28]
MKVQHRSTYALIHLGHLRHNLSVVKSLSPKAKTVGVVKANAYGHGATPIAKALIEAGCENLGVATIEEGIALREAGIEKPILVFDGMLTGHPEVFLEHQLTPVLHCENDFEILKTITKPLKVHLKFDTGMGRLGFFPNELPKVLELVSQNSFLEVEGVMSHLARADEKDPTPTKRQYGFFKKIRGEFETSGLNPIFHLANSAALLDGLAQTETGWVRPGIMLYGGLPHTRLLASSLKPVMTLITRLLVVRDCPKGTALSYGATYVTSKHSRIGVLPIGYADGYPRLLSNKGAVVIHGKKAPIVGRICMDLTLVDVTTIPEAKGADEVLLFGEKNGTHLPVEEVAKWAQTISYEILCGITTRVPRIYEET